MSSGFEVRVVGDEVGQIGQQPAVDQLDRPARGEHPDVDRVGAGRPVGQELLEQVRERHGRHVDLGAGHLLVLAPALLEAPRDHRAGPGQEVDLDALELLLRLGRTGPEGDTARKQQGHGTDRAHLADPCFHRSCLPLFRRALDRMDERA